MSEMFAERLRNGEVVLGFGLMYPSAGAIEGMRAGWDWVWIDGQHGQHDYRSILECVWTADIHGLAPIVRVAGISPEIGRVMDMNPAGIMVPMVNTPEDAREAAAATRFPPIGRRSFGGRRVIDIGGRGYFERESTDVLLLAQIETQEAAANAEAIAATDGVDVLFFGPDDMKVSLGIPINTPVDQSDELADAMERTIKAARNAGKIGGCVAATPASLRLAASLGYQFLVGGGDIVFLRVAANERIAELRAVLQETACRPGRNQAGAGETAGSGSGRVY